MPQEMSRPANTAKPVLTGLPVVDVAVANISSALAAAKLPAAPEGVQTGNVAVFLAGAINKLAANPKTAPTLAAVAMGKAVLDSIIETPAEKEKKAKEAEEKKIQDAKVAEEKKKSDEALALQKAENDKLKAENEKYKAAVAYEQRRRFNKEGVVQLGDPYPTSDHAASAALSSSRDGKA